MRWIPLSFIITLTAGGGLSAQVLTLDDAIESALVASPAVQAASARAIGSVTRNAAPPWPGR